MDWLDSVIKNKLLTEKEKGKEREEDNTYLYHGSFFKQPILKPGYLHTGKEVKWDETENNRWLYATSDRKLAIEMGFASALTQIGIDVAKFITEANKITINSDPIVSKELLQRIEFIYLYTLNSVGFTRVDNKNNKATGEYKIQGEVKPVSVEAINLSEFLSEYTLNFLASD